MYDVLFLGRLFPKNKESELRAKARVDMQDAANVLQWNLINGLIENGVSQMTVVSLLPIDSWPKHYKEPFIFSDKECYGDGFTFEISGFCNITYLKQVLYRTSCNSAVKQWAKKKGDLPKVLICYSEKNVLMRAMAAAKKIDPTIICIQIIADITEFASNADKNWLKDKAIASEIRTNRKLRWAVDGFVLLTKQMKDKLGIQKPYMVMEGIVPQKTLSKCTAKDNSVKTVLYTGSMNRKYGITNLLDAFLTIKDPNYRLVLCGLGNAEPDINIACQKDSRIQYLGKMPHDKVLELQSRATVVVNPRQNNEEFTKYSFPSKTLEYLASGVPLVAYRLDGIPEEYDEYIHYVPDNSCEALALQIQSVCAIEAETRRSAAEKARKFVFEEKNRKSQTRRILDFIKLCREKS